MLRNEIHSCYLAARARKCEELMFLGFARHRTSVPTPALENGRTPAIPVGSQITAERADFPVQGQIRPVS
ncbi:MAG TPA: hypothetical protein PKV71_17745, partial [Calditrichia bacterium]|nr:hypothetical protein [Calditrichia bacterium]